MGQKAVRIISTVLIHHETYIVILASSRVGRDVSFRLLGRLFLYQLFGWLRYFKLTCARARLETDRPQLDFFASRVGAVVL